MALLGTHFIRLYISPLIKSKESYSPKTFLVRKSFSWLKSSDEKFGIFENDDQLKEIFSQKKNILAGNCYYVRNIKETTNKKLVCLDQNNGYLLSIRATIAYFGCNAPYIFRWTLTPFRSFDLLKGVKNEKNDKLTYPSMNWTPRVKGGCQMRVKLNSRQPKSRTSFMT